MSELSKKTEETMQCDKIEAEAAWKQYCEIKAEADEQCDKTRDKEEGLNE